MRRALSMSAGVIVWAVHFAVIYGYAGLACARGWERSVTPVVAAASVIALVAAGWVLHGAWSTRERFECAIAGGLAAFAMLAIFWEGVSIAFLVPCASR